MTSWQLKTPVAFIIFNRPDTTAKVFEAIREAKPSKLFVIADGPRADKPGEAEKCAATRAIIEQVDWKCEVIKNYSDVNLGCGIRPATGITWVFEQVEEAIFLEDDCLPHPSFFTFCEQMLNRYKDDERIMMISGTNFLEEWKFNIQDYHFSYYGGIWGWASWKRAWKYYDHEIKLWGRKEIRDRICDVLSSDKQFKARAKIFWITYQNSSCLNAWDYQWSFARLAQSGLSVVPARNLISNIGFGENSTHTKSKNSKIAELKLLDLKYPIKMNDFTAVDQNYDRKFFKKVIENNLLAKLKKKFNIL
jgi:hypothetical protein